MVPHNLRCNLCSGQRCTGTGYFAVRLLGVYLETKKSKLSKLPVYCFKQLFLMYMKKDWTKQYSYMYIPLPCTQSLMAKWLEKASQ